MTLCPSVAHQTSAAVLIELENSSYNDSEKDDWRYEYEAEYEPESKEYPLAGSSGSELAIERRHTCHAMSPMPG